MNWLKRILEKRKRESELSQIPDLTFEEVTKLFFLLIPYIKTVQSLIDEYKNKKSDIQLFYDVAENLITQLSGDKLAEAAAIIFSCTPEEAKKKTSRDVALRLPGVIYKNNLPSLFLLFKMLGLFE